MPAADRKAAQALVAGRIEVLYVGYATCDNTTYTPLAERGRTETRVPEPIQRTLGGALML